MSQYALRAIIALRESVLTAIEPLTSEDDILRTVERMQPRFIQTAQDLEAHSGADLMAFLTFFELDIRARAASIAQQPMPARKAALQVVLGDLRSQVRPSLVARLFLRG